MSPPILLYRIGNFLHRNRVPILPSLITLVNRIAFGCYVPSTAELGKGVTLGYWGVGVVIHGRSVIGAGTLVRQNVTIGTKYKGGAVPRVGRDVVIGAGAVILGDVEIGDRAVIGANSVVNRSIPAGAVAVGVPARVIRGNSV
jgi:serine O-acetyltransferase